MDCGGATVSCMCGAADCPHCYPLGIWEQGDGWRELERCVECDEPLEEGDGAICSTCLMVDALGADSLVEFEED